MSTGDRWHEHGAVKDGDPTISSAVLLWMRRQGSGDESDLPWRDAETAFRPEPAPAGSPESEDVLANLLRAIENTEVAARFQNAAPPDKDHPSADARREPAETAEAASTLSKPPETGAVAAASAEPAPSVDDESNEALEMLLRAIQSTHVAAKLGGAPQADGAEAARSDSALPAETAETLSTAPQELEEAATAQLELAPQVDPAGNEPSAVALGEIQSTQIAAKLGGAPQADVAEDARSDGALPAETAETPSTAPQEPEEAATAQLELELQVDPEVDESPAVALGAIQGSDANLSLDDAPPPSDGDSAKIASSEPVEARLVLKPPVDGPPHSAAKQENRQPKRAAGRRLSGRQRLDYLLSLAAPTAAPPREAAEPIPVKPLPVAAARVVAKPKLPLISRAARLADALRLPTTSDGAAPKRPTLARIGTRIGSLAATSDLLNEGLNRAEMHLESWFQKWFGPPDPRHNMRVEKPPLVAYHWIVDVPQALKIADVSAGGLHLITKDRWSEGNIISMTLQRTDKVKGSPDSWIAVDFLVMRWCEDGVAGAFMPSTPGLNHTVAGRAANCADRKTLERFMDRLIDASADRVAVTKSSASQDKRRG